MKWKLTGRYIFSIISIVLIVLVVNTLILISMVIYQHNSGIEEEASHSAETFTRGLSQYMILTNEVPVITRDGMLALESFGAWLQFIDDYGHVISSYLSPKTASKHYTLMEIVHKYKYMDDDFNTYFVGEYEGFSYIVGIPHSEEHRFVFTLDISSMLSLASKSMLTFILVDLIIAAFIGLLFSTILTKPVNTMIERIAQLKQRNFKAQHPRRPGIYSSVYANLNDVSDTLMKQEQERIKLEDMRNEWISNVSHDLKTPLSSVQGYAELLRHEEVSVQERLQYAEVIERQAIYMKDLLDDFNLTMRLRNQAMPLQLQETRIEALIRELIIDILNDPQYRHRNVTFYEEAPELKLAIDQHLMRRAILNFIYNALMHNESDVMISVTVTHDFIMIEDNGRGIPKEDQGQIFDRYYRGTHTRSNSIGSGLGMAIARDIIKAHGMTIELESHVGIGTRVIIKYS